MSDDKTESGDKKTAVLTAKKGSGTGSSADTPAVSQSESGSSDSSKTSAGSHEDIGLHGGPLTDIALDVTYKEISQAHSGGTGSSADTPAVSQSESGSSDSSKTSVGSHEDFGLHCGPLSDITLDVTYKDISRAHSGGTGSSADTPAVSQSESGSSDSSKTSVGSHEDIGLHGGPLSDIALDVTYKDISRAHSGGTGSSADTPAVSQSESGSSDSSKTSAGSHEDIGLHGGPLSDITLDVTYKDISRAHSGGTGSSADTPAVSQSESGSSDSSKTSAGSHEDIGLHGGPLSDITLDVTYKDISLAHSGGTGSSADTPAVSQSESGSSDSSKTSAGSHEDIGLHGGPLSDITLDVTYKDISRAHSGGTESSADTPAVSQSESGSSDSSKTSAGCHEDIGLHGGPLSDIALDVTYKDISQAHSGGTGSSADTPAVSQSESGSSDSSKTSAGSHEDIGLHGGPLTDIALDVTYKDISQAHSGGTGSSADTPAVSQSESGSSDSSKTSAGSHEDIGLHGGPLTDIALDVTYKDISQAHSGDIENEEVTEQEQQEHSMLARQPRRRLREMLQELEQRRKQRHQLQNQQGQQQQSEQLKEQNPWLPFLQQQPWYQLQQQQLPQQQHQAAEQNKEQPKHIQHFPLHKVNFNQLSAELREERKKKQQQKKQLRKRRRREPEKQSSTVPIKIQRVNACLNVLPRTANCRLSVNESDRKPCYIYDHVYSALHALYDSDNDSKLKPRIFEIRMADSLRRCVVLMITGQVPTPELWRKGTVNKTNLTLSEAKWTKSVFVNPKQFLIREISPLVILISNAGRVLEVNTSGISWQLAMKNLNMTPKSLKQGFSISDDIENMTNVDVDDCFNRTKLLLNNSDMVNLQLPIKKHMRPDDEFSKTLYSVVTNKSPLLSMDTEDVNNTSRVTIVDENTLSNNAQRVYDVLVDTRNNGRDKNWFLKRFKKLEEDPNADTLLNNIRTNMNLVREEISAKLTTDAIICGHDIRSDLKALKIGHAYIIDSAEIFSRKVEEYNSSASASDSEVSSGSSSDTSGRRKKISVNKPSLKSLSMEILHEEIQKQRHCPVEDTLAVLKLVKAKLKNGLIFHNQHLENSIVDPVPVEMPAKISAVITSPLEQVEFTTQIEDLVGEAKGDLSFIHDNINYFSTESNNENVNIAIQNIISSQVTVLSMELQNKTSVDGLRDIDAITSEMFSAVPNNTLFMLLVANSSSDEGVSFMAIKHDV